MKKKVPQPKKPVPAPGPAPITSGGSPVELGNVGPVEERSLRLIPKVGAERCSVFSSGPVWSENWEKDLKSHKLWNRVADAPCLEYSAVTDLYAALSAHNPDHLHRAKQVVGDLVMEAVRSLDSGRLRRIQKTVDLIRAGFLERFSGKDGMGACEKLWDEARFLMLEKKKAPTKLELRKRVDRTGSGDQAAFSRKLKKAGLNGLPDSHATKGRMANGRKRTSRKA